MFDAVANLPSKESPTVVGNMKHRLKARHEFLERLNYITIKRGMNVADVARRMNRSYNTVYSWYAKGRITDKNIDELAKVLKVSAVWLMTGQEDVSPVRPVDDAAPPGDAVAVPTYRVNFCCGNGESEPTFEEVQDVMPAYYRKSWLDMVQADPAHLIRVRAVGDSMAPLINSGDYVLIDTSQAAKMMQFKDQIYAVVCEGLLMLKYIERNGEEVRLRGYAESVGHYVFSVDDFDEQVHIIGRVIERSGRV